MSFKLIKNFVIVGLFITLVYMSGCIEEPTIAPIKRPFSSTRIGNFAYNAESINVTIYNPDNTTIVKNDIKRNTITDYFDLPSGKRRVVVINAGNGDTLIVKEIEFSSYEESGIYFTGYFSKSNLENTFAFVSDAEGDTYVEEKPAAGKTWIRWIHLSGDSKIEAGKKVLVHVRLTNPGSTKKDSATMFAAVGSISYAYGVLEFPNVKSTVNKVVKKYHDSLVVTGKVHFSIVNANSLKDTLAWLNTTIEPGYIYNLYITGEPNDSTTMKIFESKQLPLPARPK
ncbi:MAG: hypothetical protein NTX22_02550 [Ignavibacteriales bacterium]|nr:hypothetical protein [Ignavibacteriales bacterium]